MSREINLVPEIKGQMIKALKLRNLIFFLCIVVASASIVVALIFGSIAGGQKAILDGKKETLDELSNKLNSYSELNDFLTIKDQLGNMSSISENKTVLSRVFGVLSTILPNGADTITIAELTVNLSGDYPTISFDAQANAGKDPYIDYVVLESFKKSMDYMFYDYGQYVDKNGWEIPAYCIIESKDGLSFYDQTKGYYAYWLINGEGCLSEDSSVKDYTTETYEDSTVVKIWRTPQFDSWYRENEVEGQPYMSLSGAISGVEHFESACATYSGTDSKTPVWSTSYDSCLLVPQKSEGITIGDSSNGRNSESGDLVLRFSASIRLAPEVFNFTNKHVITITQTGRYNVTDSYVQIQDIFEKRADDCLDTDLDCKNTNGGS